MDTKNITFGNLRREAQLELMNEWLNGKAIEAKGLELSTLNQVVWIEVKNPSWYADSYYRVKRIIEYPSINWEHVHKDYNYLAIDKNGLAYLYSHKPINNSYSWIFLGITVKTAKAKNFASFKPGNCEWQESLISRPGY